MKWFKRNSGTTPADTEISRPRVDRSKPPHELFPELIKWEPFDSVQWGRKWNFLSIDKDGEMILEDAVSYQYYRWSFYDMFEARTPINFSLANRRARAKMRKSQPYMDELKALRTPAK